MHSHLPPQRSACSQTLYPPTLQATEASPPAEPKSSPKAPHNRCTCTTPPFSTASRSTTYHRSFYSARCDSSSCSDSGMCLPYTPASSGTTICSRLSKSSIAAAEVYEAITSKASEGSIVSSDNDGYSFSEDFFSSLFLLLNGEEDKENKK
ncbi:uncharacterized protein MONOS_8385 [Monocercomonoides exilis]|uniref:uncharacterized protein n=1 Tax=Monocercomonoides exilis TaxID=2049356 RepID=UPI00355ABAE3|nr:hypothetical protein MONOS_8385 [Monocercomonoides exilis]|eukprot:MONOS_8385.1-p1 / transcript=MONOS_8385.1 / gene=MONOS_8385 / organism=Monocercomonoides_exilis_PA203 / gene_product=unspecified product / transcript_product=unspecified product / location=Mono_scaffold00315:10437-10889(-) / protein_length=151 / sequence_SO=supercontig / SO=protein_coding / is_pseudo=false